MAAAPNQPTVLSFEDARHSVEQHAATVRAQGRELVGLLDSSGRVLAEAVAADRDFPPFRRAARDGYAVRAADVATLPAILRVVGEIRAGEAAPKVQVGQGEAAAIMTGAPAPPGADAVVMVEYTTLRNGLVQISRGIESGANIVAAGSEARRGERLLTPGMRLDYAAIAIAASVGREHLLVYAKPRVAILATGDEIVDIAVPPGPNQIRNSNSYSLAAQVRAAGGDPVLLPIAPDEPGRLRELIAEGLETDLLLLAGGVSMGKYDLVEQVLAEFGAEFFFTGAHIQPGHPIVFGRCAASAPAPSGADAVVMVEYTTLRNGLVQISRGIESGANIVAVGSEARRGERLLTPGMRLDYAAIAIAASVGREHLLVYAKPRVAVLATGDEIVDIAVPPGPTQIRNSNTYSLAAQVRAAGGDPVLLPIAPDEPERLRELIAEGLETDLLLLAGGVSMGKYDLVEQVLAEFGAEFFFTGAHIQPGHPIVFGRCAASAPARESQRQEASGPKYFFGLPGNPVSTMVTFDLFARAILEALSGLKQRKLVFLHARLKAEIRAKPGIKRFLPGTLAGEFERAEVELLPWQGSGDIAATARANCYVVVAPDRERIAAGEWVPVLTR